MASIYFSWVCKTLWLNRVLKFRPQGICRGSYPTTPPSLSFQVTISTCFFRNNKFPRYFWHAPLFWHASFRRPAASCLRRERVYSYQLGVLRSSLRFRLAVKPLSSGRSARRPWDAAVVEIGRNRSNFGVLLIYSNQKTAPK